MASTAATLVLSAGAGDEFAGPLPGLRPRRPAFSYLLLGAFRGWGDANGNGWVTAKEAVDFANAGLSRLIERSQTPQLVGAGELVLARGRESVDLDAILRNPEVTDDVIIEPEPAGPVTEKEIACRVEAYEGAKMAGEQALQAAVEAEWARQAGAWSKVEAMGQMCLKLPRSDREDCIREAEGWLAQARVAEARVGGASVPVKTACGERRGPYPEASQSVVVAEVAAAEALLDNLKGSARLSVKGAEWVTSAGPLVWVPGGDVQMGAPAADRDADRDERPQHKVRVEGLWVMKQEATQELYQRVMGSNPAGLESCSEFEGVSLVDPL